ncbi:MAG: undecaprenyldiphospho-muramoylpentapeptide beta-N-acetylglucosaminyltransferase [Candidatus Krumholzibacteria bacterium]|nr:undecaprenyldiphospho-muramoylpentapeptide beta-N-acetylglucosaminyltransferase [Candidatus Krumholzibacteria bacterium]MDH4336670.1 undecaprenyldiphospho-muramoylpentapeptide beta-N-acetylglucosaminyltransferase [Candidatus Krumholzibacteria bacterium]MDH5269013.1 undecaprenyldiphospho-muramoylpentapeptide beta-N-acetylglucosaminyltransferase [Candidatus Krumholzibacteria bacterium]
MSDTLRIVVAGGGTGGHVYPGIAIVECLRERAATEALFVGARGGVEEGILARAGFPCELLPGYGLRGASLARRLLFPVVLARGVARALAILATFRPHVVLGTGGYASAAMVIAAVLRGTPRVLQEQNSVAGLVNRRLARFADLVLLAFEESIPSLPRGTRTLVVGNPIRKLPRAGREAAAKRFGLHASRRTVLVVGGSRGARTLNLAGADAAPRIAEALDIQFLMLVGASDRPQVERRLGAAKTRVCVLDYLDEMQDAYALADLAVARSGASSVFELAAFGVPAILVPYPYAADGHQEGNAAPLVARGAARMVADAELDGERLAREVTDLMSSPERLGTMGAAMKAWATPDAGQRAADAILDICKKKDPVRLAA